MSASERKATIERARLAGEESFRGGHWLNANPYRAVASRSAWEAGWREANMQASTVQASTVQASTVQANSEAAPRDA